jgi:hypothetical protein
MAEAVVRKTPQCRGIYRLMADIHRDIAQDSGQPKAEVYTLKLNSSKRPSASPVRSVLISQIAI